MAIINKRAALERLGDDEELYKEIVEVFFEDCPVQLESLRTALEAGDLAVVERVTHSLKSAAGNVGAESMRDIAAKMEHAAHNKKLSDLTTLYPLLTAEFMQTQTYFSQYTK